MNKKILIISIFVLIIFIGIILIIINYNKKIDISNAKHAVTIEENVDFYKQMKILNVRINKELKQGTNVYVLEEIKDKDGNKWNKVVINNKKGYILSDKLGYFTIQESDRVLMVDVSKFNKNNFKDGGELGAFIINRNISYVYIRAGGRGYGEEGKLYEDPIFKEWVEECEFLDIPFGFYFLDEAINSQEVDEEVNFIKDFLDVNKYKNNIFPIALDIEKHDEGRAEEIWADRASIVSELIQKLNEKNIDTIVYSAATTADEFLTAINTKFWLAYYPNDITKIPSKWYTDYKEQVPIQNEELMEKMVGWQFSENGAGRDITEQIDVSLIKSDFYKK